MTQGFDEWFDYYENLQCDKDSCEDAFEAGAASRQDEVSKLRTEINELKSVITKRQIQMLQIQQSCSGCDSRDLLISELQKRIDLTLNKSEDFYDFGDGESAMTFCNQIISVLKGESNERV